MSHRTLFQSARIGPLTLRNRSIRSAAFEGMCQGHKPSKELLEYHRSVAAGGIGMTTIAYAAVHQSGLSFPHQLWLKKDVIGDLEILTEAIHHEGAAASIQIGHCGLMAKRSIAGGRPLSPSGGFNLYGPTFPRAMSELDIETIIQSFGHAVQLARESGFDAVEVHAGHGYLISQFLSPFINKRKDKWGGSFENRSRFMIRVMQEVVKAAFGKIAVIVKMNMRDGVDGGMEIDESFRVAKLLEELGCDALVLSGGLVFRSPLYVMRGRIPANIMGHYMVNPFMRFGVKAFGELLMKPIHYSGSYFLDDAKQFLDKVSIPLIYVGGLNSFKAINEVLDEGFEFVSMARALINEPAFINKLYKQEITETACNHANYCIAVMYSGKMACHQHVENLPERWKNELEKGAF